MDDSRDAEDALRPDRTHSLDTSSSQRGQTEQIEPDRDAGQDDSQANVHHGRVNIIDLSSDSDDDKENRPPSDPQTTGVSSSIAEAIRTCTSTIDLSSDYDGDKDNEPSTATQSEGIPPATVHASKWVSDAQTRELKFANANEAENAGRIRLAPVSDDVETVMKDQKYWVREICAACLSSQKGLQLPDFTNRARFEQHMAECEQKILEIHKHAPDQSEMWAWCIVDRVFTIHLHGILHNYRASSKAAYEEWWRRTDTATRNMTCSDRMRLIVEIVSEYAVVALDVAQGENLSNLVIDPLQCLATKLGMMSSDRKKRLETVQKEWSAEETEQSVAKWDLEHAERGQRQIRAEQQADNDFAAEFTFFVAPSTGAPLGFYVAQAGAHQRRNNAQG